MKNIIGIFLCWIGKHKLDDNDWEDIWEEDGYSGKDFVGQKNCCKRCGEYVTRKERKERKMKKEVKDKLDKSNVSNSILVEMLNEMYDIGVEEGRNSFYNDACSCGKDDCYEIIGKEKHVEMLIKKYYA